MLLVMLIRLASWNVNGIRSVWAKGELQKFVSAYQPDILCLQETKAERGQSEVDLPDYEEYWNSADKKGYSGTAIFSKIRPLKVANGLPDAIVQKYALKKDGYGDPNKEGRVITAEFNHFYVISVYTPNAKDDLSRLNLRHKHWDPAFLEYCRALEAGRVSLTDDGFGPARKSGKPVIFGGDLNVAHTEDDLARPKDNRGKKGFTDQEREGIEQIIKAGFVDSLRLFVQGNGHYTWWTHWANARARNVGWRIDYFFASQALAGRVKKAEILAGQLGSDHCPIGLVLDV